MPDVLKSVVFADCEAALIEEARQAAGTEVMRAGEGAGCKFGLGGREGGAANNTLTI